MAIDLRNHPYFEAWQDPESGIETFILKERVAPLQQSFYYTNPSLSADERWLWMYVAYPPSPHKFLAAVSLDPERPEKHVFYETGFSSVSPLVAPEGDAVYFCMGPSVWKQCLDGSLTRVCTLSSEYINNRQLRRLATHLTLSADGRYLLLDGEVGNHWFVSVGDVHTGQVRVIKEFIHHYNHAQFSPVDPQVFSIAQDWFLDKVTGRRFPFDHRVWLMDIDGNEFRTLTPDYQPRGQEDCHEWWSKDGRVCYVNYAAGVYEIDLSTRERTHVWKQALCHAHASSDRRYWCADQSPYRWEETGCQVRFFDRQNGRQVNIISRQPKPLYPRGDYHIDPHPQFSPRDTWVVHTTTVRGLVDVALTPVAPLLS
jgi:hypothetical protein